MLTTVLAGKGLSETSMCPVTVPAELGVSVSV
jgi:hypothetical protein